MKILFNEIAQKMLIFYATCIGVTCFFNRDCTSSGGGGHKIFDHQIGGHKSTAEVGLLSEIHDPPIPKKMVAP